MDKIKKFFDKKKVEAKFKSAGVGHRLNEANQKPQSSGPSLPQQRSNVTPTAAQQQAAAAAVARLEKNKEPTPQSRSAALIRLQALKELELEKQSQLEKRTVENQTSVSKGHQVSDELAVKGVYFKCPLIGPEVLPKKEIEEKIKNFLYEQLDNEEGGLTACLLIHTVNKNKEKVRQCIDTLFRYLDNIVQNPAEDKYKKIRTSNKVYQEKVAPIEGSRQFLLAAGFQIQNLPNPQGEIEDFWVFNRPNVPETIECLTSLRDALVSAEAIRPELDRSVQVLLPSQAAQRIELPPDFFWISTDEIKREQQLLSEQVERSLMLRTKAMREREEQAQQRKYRFALMRIKFPDGIVLQGTFKVNEKFLAVRQFIEDSLQDPSMEFTLISSTGNNLNDSDSGDATLLSLQLVPSAILHFKPAEQNNTGYLKDDLMILVQSV